MAKYHVHCNTSSGVIYAGTVNKKGDKWLNMSEATEEALEAVRNHLLFIKEKQNIDQPGFQWQLDNGNVVSLILAVGGPETLAKKEEEND